MLLTRWETSGHRCQRRASDSGPGDSTTKLDSPLGKARKLQIPFSGLTWSRNLDKIAFAILNQNSGESELWTVSSDGANAVKIYSTRLGRICYPAFIRTTN
jgi:hypothetical protein